MTSTQHTMPTLLGAESTRYILYIRSLCKRDKAIILFYLVIYHSSLHNIITLLQVLDHKSINQMSKLTVKIELTHFKKLTGGE